MKQLSVPGIVSFLVALVLVVPPPTAAAAAKLDFPAKGRTVTIIVPFAAGGTGFLGAQALAAPLEKELGVQIQVVAKPGASSQTGMTQLALSKPDGYTLGVSALPTSITPYLDPERKAVYSRKSLVAVANHVLDPEAIAVRAESPYKTLKDLVAAAKANPGGIRLGTAGLLSDNHLAQILFQQAAGIKFSFVHFDGGAPATIALLGGHVDVGCSTAGNYPAHYKSGKVRLLGIMAKERSKFFPDIPTLEELGYKISYASSRGLAAPEGTPRGIVELWSRAIKKAMDDPEHKRKMDELAIGLHYLDADQYAKYWDEFEAQTKPLLEMGKREQQK